eukprot:1161480-Pelagomonas_calceolata.AAC.6
MAMTEDGIRHQGCLSLNDPVPCTDTMHRVHVLQARCAFQPLITFDMHNHSGFVSQGCAIATSDQLLQIRGIKIGRPCCWQALRAPPHHTLRQISAQRTPHVSATREKKRTEWRKSNTVLNCRGKELE